ncbi:MAG: hypothetical protein UW64_C0033G0005 [Microgenomates group bacterium GW2011_GWC1_44_37]|nr:MAG: hypothetical protein UW64_C0033G0005 [Microgenomates group bacterium GW2011_GWC1_44_37]
MSKYHQKIILFRNLQRSFEINVLLILDKGNFSGNISVLSTLSSLYCLGLGALLIDNLTGRSTHAASVYPQNGEDNWA